jgi:hypothetical protein
MFAILGSSTRARRATSPASYRRCRVAIIMLSARSPPRR